MQSNGSSIAQTASIQLETMFHAIDEFNKGTQLRTVLSQFAETHAKNFC